MIAIASFLHRQHLGLLKGNAHEYTPGIFAAFDGDEFVSTYPKGTALDLALASAAYENTKSTSDQRLLMTLEARYGNEEAANWLTRYPE